MTFGHKLPGVPTDFDVTSVYDDNNHNLFRSTIVTADNRLISDRRD